MSRMLSLFFRTHFRLGTKRGNRNLCILFGVTALVCIGAVAAFNYHPLSNNNVSKIERALKIGDARQQAEPLDKEDKPQAPEQLLCPEGSYDPAAVENMDCITNTEQLGANPYYKVDVSTPQAFYNAVKGVGFNEGYGEQCVAGFKEFTYSLSGRIVATSNGGANGYRNQVAQIESLGFKWHTDTDYHDGDWGIFNSGAYGHVAMFINGHWAFGQNQRGNDIYKGYPFTEDNINLPLYGYYRPNTYQQLWDDTHKPAPTPEPNIPVQPAPEPPQPTRSGYYFRWDQMMPYTGQESYYWCYEYDKGGCWAR